LSFYGGVGVGVLKIEELRLLCTDSTALNMGYLCHELSTVSIFLTEGSGRMRQQANVVKCEAVVRFLSGVTNPSKTCQEAMPVPHTKKTGK
jgi:hypothetical protein